MVMFFVILLVILLSTAFCAASVFFNDESCLPYKRKMEKMIQAIKIYQNKIETPNIEFTYKGKKFNVGVIWFGNSFTYGGYKVFINENHIMTWHILRHLFSKSRLEEHHGDMKSSEEYEIIQAAYKYAKKANDEWWNVKSHKPSYFD